MLLETKVQASRHASGGTNRIPKGVKSCFTRVHNCWLLLQSFQLVPAQGWEPYETNKKSLYSGWWTMEFWSVVYITALWYYTLDIDIVCPYIIIFYCCDFGALQPHACDVAPLLERQPILYSLFNDWYVVYSPPPPSLARPAGLLTTKITESPRKNILLTYRSLFTATPLVLPLPPLDFSVHISLTSSSSLRERNLI